MLITQKLRKRSWRALVTATAISLPAAAIAGDPYFGPRPAMIVNQSDNVDVDVTPVDPDGDPMTVTVTGLPPGMTLEVVDSDWHVSTIHTFTPGNPQKMILPEANGTFLALSSNGLSRIVPNGSESLLSNVPNATDIARRADGSLILTGRHKLHVWQNGQLSHFAGPQTTYNEGYQDGALAQALFRNPLGLALAPNGDLFVAENRNRSIRKISGGQVSTLTRHTPHVALWPASSGNLDYRYTGIRYYGGGIFAVDPFGRQILRIDPVSGNETVLANAQTTGFANQYPPSGLAFSNSGDLLVTKGASLLRRKADGSFQTLMQDSLASIGSSNCAASDGFSGAAEICRYSGLIRGAGNDPALYFIDGNPSPYLLRKLQELPSEWSITGQYSGGNCGGSYQVLVTATDSNGDSATTSVNMTIPSQGPGCGPPPGGPPGATPSGPGGRTVPGTGNPVITRPSGGTIQTAPSRRVKKPTSEEVEREEDAKSPG